MINANDIIKEQLRKGNDAEARAELVAELERICQQSTEGNMGLGDFISDLQCVIGTAKVYLTYWRE